MASLPFFRKYLFPALFGLLVYVSIRLVNDIISDMQFWKRAWITNFLEIGTSIVMGYIF